MIDSLAVLSQNSPSKAFEKEKLDLNFGAKPHFFLDMLQLSYVFVRLLSATPTKSLFLT